MHPRIILFGNASDVNSGTTPELDELYLLYTLKTILRDYVDKIIVRQNHLIDAYIRSQSKISSHNVEMRHKQHTPSKTWPLSSRKFRQFYKHFLVKDIKK